MARILTEKDIEILKKLAPECEDTICAGSGSNYRSILPPVSNHYALDENDFEDRLSRLDPKELTYISEVILDGSESLFCVQPEYVDILIRLLAERVSKDIADQVKMIYETVELCEY
jgi:hypothetical protein